MMEYLKRPVMHVVAAIVLGGLAWAAPLHAPDARAQAAASVPADDIEELHTRLADPDEADWRAVERSLVRAWARSGSAAMDLLLLRGRAAIARGDHRRAVEHLTALTEMAPDFAEGWNARATAFYAQEEFGLSMDDIRRTLALNPRHFGALAGLGRILEQLGEDQAALRAYREALRINPHLAPIRDAAEALEAKVGGQAL